MNRSILVALLLAGVGTVASAQQTAHRGSSEAFMGYNNISCPVWVSTRAENPEEAGRYSAWIYGFVSAYNHYALELPGQPSVSTGTTLGEMDTFVDSYCEEHSGEHLPQATVALLDFLTERSGAY